jgi:hypothetical protein
MDEVRSHMPKVGNETCRFAKIRSAEPRLAAMFMQVNVKHADFIVQRNLQRSPNGLRTHHCTHRLIVKVIIICHWMKALRQDHPTRGFQSTHSTMQESHSLGREWMWSTQVRHHLA